MSAHLYDKKLSYFSVPKCACTSLKMFFFEIANNFSWQNFRIDNHTYHIHQFYVSRPFKESVARTREDHIKLTLIRDPVSRLVSCFRNRVDSDVGRNIMRQHTSEFLAKKLPVHPNWNQFLDNIETYKEIVPMVKHHSEPLSYFIGNDPSYFDRIFSLQDIDDFVSEVAKIVGNVPELNHAQKIGTKFNVSSVSEVDLQKIRLIMAEDYDIFGKYFIK